MRRQRAEPVVEAESFWAHWGNIEWLISGIITAGSIVAAFVGRLSVFVYKLTVKIAILEHMIETNEEQRVAELARMEREQSRRHEENVHLQRGTMMRMDGLTNRIDQWMRPRSIS